MADDEHRPHYYGGQAVLEGVMMRGRAAWAVAVRRPSGEIYVERHPVGDFQQRRPIFTKPLFRGPWALVDALKIGTKALTISANQSVEDEEKLSGKELGGSLVIALLLFIVIFIALPNFGLAALLQGRVSEFTYHVVEGLVRIVMFLGYLGAISLLPDIKRVFAYHGAEHQTIAAWEHEEPLQPDRVAGYPTLHVRCGTNFLVMVMVLSILVYTLAGGLVPPPDGGFIVYSVYHIGLRVLLLPVVAGVAYEGLRLGAGRSNPLVRGIMRPGLWLQLITTKPSTLEMREVAIRAFQAVVPVEELEGRPVPTDESELASPIVWGPDEATDVAYALSPDTEPRSGR